MSIFYKKGFTAFELLVIVAIIGILVSVTLPQFTKIKENQTLQGAVDDVLSSISKARSETMASVNSLQYGVHFQSNSVIIFQGTSYSAGAGTNETISLSSPASISNVTLGGVSSTSGDIYFNLLYGAPSTTGTVTVSTSSNSKTITILATGTASVN